jgi:hypothetical protein
MAAALMAVPTNTTTTGVYGMAGGVMNTPTHHVHHTSGGAIPTVNYQTGAPGVFMDAYGRRFVRTTSWGTSRVRVCVGGEGRGLIRILPHLRVEEH